MDRIDLLNKAIELTGGDRMKSYGPPVENHERIAAIYSAVTDNLVSASDVATMLMCVKLARIQTDPMLADSYVDLMAYAGIAFECTEAEQ